MMLDHDPAVRGDYQKAFIRCSGKVEPQELIMAFRGEFNFLSNFEDGEVSLPAETFRTWNPATGTYGYRTLPEATYRSSENAYMAWKWSDLTVRQKMQGMTPGESKTYNNTLRDLPEAQRPLLRPDYTDLNRVRIMLYLLRQKFDPARHPDLSDRLLATEVATLVEGNTWNDQFFGFNVKNGIGHNYLGRILMQVRNELRIAAGLAPVFYKMPLLSKAEMVPYYPLAA